MADRPSSSSLAAMPAIYRPPPPPERPTQFLQSSQDLIGLFNLQPSYDKYVRPSAKAVGSDGDCDGEGETSQPGLFPTLKPATPAATPSANTLDKGKGKQTDPFARGPSAGPAGPSTLFIKSEPVDADEDGGDKKRKKKEQSYRHLIKHLPGKHAMKKDDYFVNLIHAPPKQLMKIAPFDGKVLREAFTVKEGGIVGFNKAVLMGLDEKEKEAKKRKKEEKRAAKERARLAALEPPPTPGAMPSPTISVMGTVGMSAGKPGIPRVVARGGSTAPTPRPTQAPTPGSRRPSVQGATPGPSTRATPPSSVPRAATPRQPSVKVETPNPSLPPAPIRTTPKPGGAQQVRSATPNTQRPPPAGVVQPARRPPAPPQNPPAATNHRPSVPPTGQGAVQRPKVATPGAAARPAVPSAADAAKRGKIRKEREDDVQPTRPGAPATPGLPQRPIKKPRLDGPGTAPKPYPQRPPVTQVTR